MKDINKNKPDVNEVNFYHNLVNILYEMIKKKVYDTNYYLDYTNENNNIVLYVKIENWDYEILYNINVNGKDVWEYFDNLFLAILYPLTEFRYFNNYYKLNNSPDGKQLYKQLYSEFIKFVKYEIDKFKSLKNKHPLYEIINAIYYYHIGYAYVSLEETVIGSECDYIDSESGDDELGKLCDIYYKNDDITIDDIFNYYIRNGFNSLINLVEDLFYNQDNAYEYLYDAIRDVIYEKIDEYLRKDATEEEREIYYRIWNKVE